MADSFYDQRRAELGITAAAGNSSPGKAPTQGSSFYDQKRMELGIVPDTRPKQSSQDSGKAILDGLTPGLRAMAGPKKIDTTNKSPRLQNPTSPNPLNSLLQTKDTLQKANEATQGNHPKPLYKQVLGGLKNVADKTGVTKAAEVVGSVLNAPGDLIREFGSHTTDINNALYNNPVFHTINKVLPHAPAGQKLFADGGTVGQHLQQMNENLDIPGVTTGPAANFVRGFADTMDFGTGRALDEAIGNKEALAGRNTTAAKAGGIASMAVPFVGGGVGLIKKGAQAIKPLVKGAKQGIEELGNVATGGLNSGFVPGAQAADAASPTMRHIVSGTKKETGSLSQVADKAYINHVDDIFALKRADERAAAAKGTELQPTQSAYDMAMASRGSDQISKQILTDKLVDMGGNEVGAGLKEVMSGVGKKNLGKFEDYLLNRHAITRYGRGEKVYPDSYKWTPETGQAIMSNYEKAHPQFKDTAEKLKTFQDDMVQKWLVDSGLIKQEVADAWKKENPTYVPMNRQFSDLEKSVQGFGSKAGMAGQKAPVKEYDKNGSQRPIIKPIEPIIGKVDAFVKAAKRNQSMQALVRNIQDHPEVYKGLAEIVPDAPHLDDIRNVDLSSADGVDEVLARLHSDFSTALKSNRKDLGNVVRAMVDGNPVYVKIHDKNLLDAVTSINPEMLDSITKVASNVTRAWKAVLTGINPIFTLTRSIFRDPVSAYVQSKSVNNPIKYVSDLAQAGWSVMRNDSLYKEFKRMGGGFTSPNVGTPNLLNRSKRAIMPSDSKIHGAVQRFGDHLAEVLDKVESAVRVAEYKRVRGAGSTDERLKALSAAQEVAVNFQRRGRKGRGIDAWLPYYNSSVQSVDKLVRTIKDQPGAALTKATLSVTVPSLLLYYKNHSDPAYQQLTEFEKDRFLHIPMGDGKFFRIPLPQELVPFAAVPRRILEQMLDKNPQAWQDFGKTMTLNFLPPGAAGGVQGYQSGGIPGAVLGGMGDSFFAPLVDVATNQSWSGSPIVPSYLQKASAQNQFDSRTSGISKRISSITGGSPMKLDYLIRSYGGDLGNIVQGVADKGVKSLSGVAQGIGKRMIVDSAVSNDIMNNFYSLKDKIDTQYNDAKLTGNVPKGYNDSIRLYLDRAAGNMSTVTKALRAIDKLQISDKEKQSRKTQLTTTRNNIARQAHQAVTDAMKNSTRTQ